MKRYKVTGSLIFIIVILLTLGNKLLFNHNLYSSSNYSVAQIDKLTTTENVLGYIRQHQKLPDYYITKKQARKAGWKPVKGNLCTVLPGKAIGGDIFQNRDGKLPKKANRIWFEADVNYHCGRRGKERVLYSNDVPPLIYITHDHYQTMVLISKNE